MSFLDIAVGAPWGGKDGNGAVYVYYGQRKEQQPLKLMQVRPKIIISLFPSDQVAKKNLTRESGKKFFPVFHDVVHDLFFIFTPWLYTLRFIWNDLYRN